MPAPSVAAPHPDDRPLPTPTSLRAAAQSAHHRGQPLVVMVSLKACPFCVTVRRHYLGPMLERGEIAAVQIDMRDRSTPLQDVQGTLSTAHAVARAWKVRVAPTLLFLDDRGRELVERLEGVALADFYGEYLNRHLETARQRLHHPAT